MNSKASLPSFPIGLNWSFSPKSKLWGFTPDESPSPVLSAAIDVWSLPLEAAMIHGGPMQKLIKTLAARYQLVFRSGYLGYIDHWDAVHRSTFETMANDTSPAYIVFDKLRLERSKLPQFEREILKATDAVGVLPIAFEIKGNALVYDELWLRDLLTRTRLQLSVPLDFLFRSVTLSNWATIKPQLEKLFVRLFADPLRIAEIKVATSLPMSYDLPEREALQFETWRDLIFDFDASSTIIWDWDERKTTEETLRRWLRASLALRGSGPAPAYFAPYEGEIESDETEFQRAFKDIYAQLCSVQPSEVLNPLIEKFRLWLTCERSSTEVEIHEEMRYWPVFLKSENSLGGFSAWIALSLEDWARFAAGFHPADELVEQNALLVGEVKANPTVQPRLGLATGQFMGQTTLRLIFRRHHLDPNELYFEREINWAEAAVVDEVQENFKLNVEVLMQHLISIPSPLGQRQPKAFWRETLSNLVQAGIILFKTGL